MNPSNRLTIFDTTLRDGEQAPGCSMRLPEKMRVASALAELGVDIIEAGFPAASPGDFTSVQTIAREIEGPIVCGLARCTEGDIDTAWKALQDARRARIHVFIATSPIHREHKLGMSRDEVLDQAVRGVRRARALCDNIEFSAEDALRTEPEFLAQVIAAAIDAGATTVNIPDTVGYTVPAEIRSLFEYLRREVSNIDAAVLSAHCHDDLGMAVANSLAAVEAGARQVECTINGIGERAGNCSLEEVVMAVRTRATYFGVSTGVQTERLYPTSRLVADVTGAHVARNKAIVGANAFAHEAGIHQHGMLQHHSTYEIMSPKDVGIRASNLVLGKHSGRHAFRDRISDLGFDLDRDELERVFVRFKTLADKKKEVFDADIEALVLDGNPDTAGPWALLELQVTTGKGHMAVAAVKLRHQSGRELDEAATGHGPIEAAFTAIERVTGIAPRLDEFDVHSVTVGEDAQGEVHVTVEQGGQLFRGKGVSTDIITASARAFLQATNRIARQVARHDETRKTAPETVAAAGSA